MKYLPPSHCKLLMTPCIIKNKLNPTIMSCCDNQKLLIHFLLVPPSTHQLPECIFPMSFESVSPKKEEKKPRKAHRKALTSPGAPLSITGTRCPSSPADVTAGVFACAPQKLHHKTENGVRGRGATVWECNVRVFAAMHTDTVPSTAPLFCNDI